ncbi:hypothetical protein L596_015286 [Steinernema carpocapsae]|uniref:C-type lectin domain-containing protein n=1 Tax=Steinernema carpocapsae TaxID=34508 RepID=A0A4U5NFF3_STECR|nr:hypothetical protein L596_015286 [Steinernema carpocapsae]
MENKKGMKLVLLLLAFSSPAVFAEPCSPCSRGSVLSSDGSKCFRVVKTPVAFGIAAEICRGLGVDFASVTNAQDNAIIEEHLKDSNVPDAWLGGSSYWYKWSWADGSRFHYTNWGKHEPSNWFWNHCIAMRAQNGKWKSNLCLKAKAFVCEGKAVEVPTLPPRPNLRHLPPVPRRRVPLAKPVPARPQNLLRRQLPPPSRPRSARLLPTTTPSAALWSMLTPTFGSRTALTSTSSSSKISRSRTLFSTAATRAPPSLRSTRIVSSTSSPPTSAIVTCGSAATVTGTTSSGPTDLSGTTTISWIPPPARKSRASTSTGRT